MKQSSKNFTNPIGLLSITLLVLCICVYKIDFAIRNFALKKTHLQITYNQFKTRKKTKLFIQLALRLFVLRFHYNFIQSTPQNLFLILFVFVLRLGQPG